MVWRGGRRKLELYLKQIPTIHRHRKLMNVAPDELKSKMHCFFWVSYRDHPTLCTTCFSRLRPAKTLLVDGWIDRWVMLCSVLLWGWNESNQSQRGRGLSLITIRFIWKPTLKGTTLNETDKDGSDLHPWGWVPLSPSPIAVLWWWIGAGRLKTLKQISDNSLYTHNWIGGLTLYMLTSSDKIV